MSTQSRRSPKDDLWFREKKSVLTSQSAALPATFVRAVATGTNSQLLPFSPQGSRRGCPHSRSARVPPFTIDLSLNEGLVARVARLCPFAVKNGFSFWPELADW